MTDTMEQKLVSQKISSLKSPGVRKNKNVTFSIEENNTLLDENLRSSQNIGTSIKKRSKRVTRKCTPIAENVSPSTDIPRKVSYDENQFGVPNKISELTILPVSVEYSPNYSSFEKKRGAPKGPGRKSRTVIDSFTNTEPKVKRNRLVKPFVELTSQGTEAVTDTTNYKYKQRRKKSDKCFGTQTDEDQTNYKTKRSRVKTIDEDESQTKNNNNARQIPRYGSKPSKSCATQTDTYITNLKPKQYIKPYSEDRDPNNGSLSAVQNKQNKYKNKHYCQLHPEDEKFSAKLYPKSDQSQSEQKKRMPTSNKNGVDRKGELFNEVKVFIPCESHSYEENVRGEIYPKEHQYSKNEGITNESSIPVQKEPEKNDNSSQFHPKDKNYSIFDPKLKHSKSEKKNRASSNNHASRRRLSDANKSRSFSNHDRRRSSDKCYSQAQQQQSEQPYDSRLSYEGGASLVSDIEAFIPCEQHEDTEKHPTKENRRHLPIDRDALKAKLEIIGKELKEKERKREELLKILKEADSEKKKKPDVAPIRYSRNNSNPPLDREALREAKTSPSTQLISNNPQSQRRAGGDADYRQSKRPNREIGDTNNTQSVPNKLWSKAPRSKSHVYAMKRYHIQIPEKGKKETPFKVRFNLNDEQSVDMTYNGPVKISNYYSTTKYN